MQGWLVTAPAPCGAPQTDPRVLPGHQGDDQHREGSALHPDVLAYADQLVGPVTPYRLRYLQRQYLDPPEDSLTPAGIEIRKNYGRLVSLQDGFKAVRKARVGKESILA